jgi:thioredoxin family protein
MRPEVAIAVPEFPPKLAWLNVPFLRMNTLLGRSAALVWFWDCCSLNALRALPYLQEWDRRYGTSGLRVLGVHSPQFEFGKDRGIVEAALRRLQVGFPVALDSSFETWKLYGNEVWPALYLWDRRGMLRYYHFGEGAYEDTEQAIHEALLEIDDELELPTPMAPLRQTDGPDALVQVPTPHVYLEEDRSRREVAAGEELRIRYTGATAAAVLDGSGEVELFLDGTPFTTIVLDGPRLYELVESPEHEEHELKLRFHQLGAAYAFSFAPGPA